MRHYRAKDLMVPNPAIIGPDSSLEKAAKEMKKLDCGILPVGTRNKVIGMISDRDIVIRALAQGKDPAETTVDEIMTDKAIFITEDTSLLFAADVMNKEQVNRLIVKDAKGKITGILSLSGLIRETACRESLGLFLQNLADKCHNDKKSA